MRGRPLLPSVGCARGVHRSRVGEGGADASRPNLARMTSTIRVGAPHDLLALIPALAGYRPERSLVCLAFTQSRAVGVLRYDLPSAPADHGPLADAAVSALCRIPAVDGVAAIVYTDHRYRGRAAAGERALLRELMRRVHAAGFTVYDALRVAADAWGSLLDRDAPPEGRSPAEIAASPLGGHTAVRGAASRAVDACAALPALDTVEREAIRAAIGPEADRVGDPVALIESLLEDPPGDRPVSDEDPSPEDIVRLARLIIAADIPVFRDAMMLQIAFGPAFGEIVLEHGLATTEAATDAGQTVAEYVEALQRTDPSPAASGSAAAPGSAAAHGSAAASGAADPSPAALGVALSRVLLGETEERPDADRVELGLTILKRAAASATGRPRAALLCMSAWLAWALGRGSAAWALIEAALAVDGEHGMSRLLARVFASGRLPEWAFHPQATGFRPPGGGLSGSSRTPAGRP